MADTRQTVVDATAQGARDQVDRFELNRATAVVDTGWWIFGKKRLIPAGAITAIDDAEKRVAVQMTKDEIKSAPDYEAGGWDDSRREMYEQYYGPFGW